MIVLTYEYWKDDINYVDIADVLDGSKYDYSYRVEVTDFGEPGFYDFNVDAFAGPVRFKLPRLSYGRITRSEVLSLMAKHEAYGMAWLKRLFCDA